MSMSIFTSFDALSAEFFGQKVYLAPSNTNKPTAAAAATKVDDLKKGTEVKSSSEPVKTPEDRRRIRAPRFAVELDGVHCFETILPY
ncbi:UNVERIFIED_CONTAM: hypothetical protein Sradi_6634800 [Sesamum radiatum]|uniref:Uncharacterized protein n=1 Tax=Sesamum radiatum TaxID=300843 RepID=A0AAW2JYQ8_SESRA